MRAEKESSDNLVPPTFVHGESEGFELVAVVKYRPYSTSCDMELTLQLKQTDPGVPSSMTILLNSGTMNASGDGSMVHEHSAAITVSTLNMKHFGLTIQI